MEYDPIMGRIKVIKVDEDGNPLAGVGFQVYRQSPWEMVYDITTGADETATTIDLPYGGYELSKYNVPDGLAADSWYYASITEHDTTAEYTMVNYPAKGDVKITKTGNDGKAIPGVVFEIYNADTDALVQTVTTNSGGYVWSSYMPLGSYYAVEKSVPAPYKLDTTRHDFSFTYHYESAYLNIVNKVGGIPDKVKVIKTDDSNNPLSGVVFTLYRAWDSKKLGNLTTAEDGIAASGELIPDENGAATSGVLNEGGYYLLDLESPEGYIPSTGRHPFSISKNGVTVPVAVTNQRIYGSVKVIKTGENGETLYGITFGIFDADTDEKIATIKTDWSGEAESGTLHYGNYYLKELEAADGYELIDTPIPFTISEQDVVLEIPVTNPMIVGGVSVLKLSGDQEVRSGRVRG